MTSAQQLANIRVPGNPRAKVHAPHPQSPDPQQPVARCQISSAGFEATSDPVNCRTCLNMLAGNPRPHRDTDPRLDLDQIT